MNRHTATFSMRVALWNSFESALQALARGFTAAMADDSIALVDRERRRIYRDSRHWLMG